jgi:hypothetical protein
MRAAGPGMPEHNPSGNFVTTPVFCQLFIRTVCAISLVYR